MNLKEPIAVLDHGWVRYVGHLGDDNTPLEAARLSTGNPTGKDEEKDDALRDYLWRHGHHSPFEMCELAIEAQLPLFVHAQWMTHRTLSKNTFSGRYSEMPDLCYMPEPERVTEQSDTNKQGSGEAIDAMDVGFFRAIYEQDQELVRDSYKLALSKGVAREVARINLPLAQYTRFRVKGNLRNWFHFLKLRMDEHAQYEIRVYAEAVASIMWHLWPKTCAVFQEHSLDAVTFSSTEMLLIRGAMMQYGASKDDIINFLGGSKGREFLAKVTTTP